MSEPLLAVVTSTAIQAVQSSYTSESADAFEKASRLIARSLRAGGTIYFVGNGGSAADAQHLAAELVGRMQVNRRPLRGLALTTDTSALTALVNDYDPNDVFARQIEAFGSDGDVLVAISTSGESENVIRACRAARQCGCAVVGMTGGRKGRILQEVDVCLETAFCETPIVQAIHILWGQALLEVAERAVLEDTHPGGPHGQARS